MPAYLSAQIELGPRQILQAFDDLGYEDKITILKSISDNLKEDTELANDLTWFCESDLDLSGLENLISLIKQDGACE